MIDSIDRNQDTVIIANRGGSGLDLNGWTLAVENSDKRCPLQTVLPAGGSLRVWAGTGVVSANQLNCNLAGGMFAGNNNAALLIDPAGITVARRQ